jgi:hypothetical protein
MKILRRLSCALALSVLAAPPSSTLASEWEWALTPYIWGSDITLDAAINDTQVAGSETTFDEILDDLDLALLVHFEARRGRGGFFSDLVYFDLSDQQAASGSPPVASGTTAASTLEQFLVEAGGFYRPSGEQTGLDVLFGVRLIDLSLDIAFDFPAAPDRTVTRDSSLLDGFIGLRYSGSFATRWAWWIRGDIGAGDTDLSAQAFAGIGVSFGERLDDMLVVAYRHLVFEVEDDVPLGVTELDMTASGLLIGYRFAF